MIRNKIKKLMSKKLLFYSFVLIFVLTVALAFIPHYSCACGDEGNNKKLDGSILSQHIGKIVENIANAIRPIFK
jgi:cytochrome c oxidase assembly protein Cox11